MDKENALEILARIKENTVVLDVGGWFCPFNRANWVVDFMPYESRGKGGSVGGGKEYFSRQTWVRRDMCDKSPLPFKDKEIDFTVCSHTLEDVRDPVFICSEIRRISKQGYIEVPSKLAELSFGVESARYAGYSHHRWIAEILNNKISFFHKSHLIHSLWKYHFPASYGRHIKQEDRFQCLFWEDSFDFEERINVEFDVLLREIKEFIASSGVYPESRYRIDELKEAFKKTRAYKKLSARFRK